MNIEQFFSFLFLWHRKHNSHWNGIKSLLVTVVKGKSYSNKCLILTNAINVHRKKCEGNDLKCCFLLVNRTFDFNKLRAIAEMNITEYAHKQTPLRTEPSLQA
ncbi:unnamed protein product, partial [Brugia timori]|uniref:Secreted protein n=1 Tax=Brugia timori TaxID=42155 RepID=A0A0R3QHQ5_9BILA